jgi:hypothetical protein
MTASGKATTNSGEGIGGARRDRTADLVIANDALSQLSYGPKNPVSSEDAEYGQVTGRCQADALDCRAARRAVD